MKKNIVCIDLDLEDIIPGYIENRYKDVELIKSALDDANFEAIRVIGHSMKGSGGGYGFDGVTQIGQRLEMAAKQLNKGEITDALTALAAYLDTLEIVYEEAVD